MSQLHLQTLSDLLAPNESAIQKATRNLSALLSYTGRDLDLGRTALPAVAALLACEALERPELLDFNTAQKKSSVTKPIFKETVEASRRILDRNKHLTKSTTGSPSRSLSGSSQQRPFQDLLSSLNLYLSADQVKYVIRQAEVTQNILIDSTRDSNDRSVDLSSARSIKSILSFALNGLKLPTTYLVEPHIEDLIKLHAYSLFESTFRPSESDFRRPGSQPPMSSFSPAASPAQTPKKKATSAFHLHTPSRPSPLRQGSSASSSRHKSFLSDDALSSDGEDKRDLEKTPTRRLQKTNARLDGQIPSAGRTRTLNATPRGGRVTKRRKRLRKHYIEGADQINLETSKQRYLMWRESFLRAHPVSVDDEPGTN
ncbi:hypothetical protein [Phaffia rhodozyma]|uniref:Uncharacterized protein n=1 Tax=Phaffia rhodozyma TaxID=264483 RepID=A0A0F7SKG9_PHARH|nr:hypothetical protein [Phaffia rhodozyma]